MNNEVFLGGELFNPIRSYSKSISGHLLTGDQPLRYIFIDEAGTHLKSKMTLVLGVIADADLHIMDAERLALEAYDGIPKELKEDFVFHAYELFGDKKYQVDLWSMADRLQLLELIMRIPRRLGMGICFGTVVRGNIDWGDELLSRVKNSAPYMDHAAALGYCLGAADRAIRDRGRAREVATVIAENLPNGGLMNTFKKIPINLRNGFMFSPPDSGLSKEEQELGYRTQTGDMIRVRRIRNSIHFVEKDEDPLVQVADACAFGLRRYLIENDKFGHQFAEAIFGEDYQSTVEKFIGIGGAWAILNIPISQ